MKADRLVLVAVAIFGMTVLFTNAEEVAAGKTSSTSTFDAEKKTALANPYANDLGPATLSPMVLATYPPEHQKAYKDVLQVKCAKCHTPSRPLNSQFLEPLAKKEEKASTLAAWNKSNPEIFKNKTLWQPEADIWQRYVKRMMSKPGCGITPEEGKAVWGFLVYDSNQRKIGKNQAAWKAHRTKILEEFKKKHPARYKELYEKR